MFTFCSAPAVDVQVEREGDKERIKKQTYGVLGVIRIDYDYPPAPGDIDHPGSFNCPVIYRVVPGLTFEICQAGTLTPQVETDFKNAIQWLVSQGASAIIGDCGFLFFYQKVARSCTHVPIALSSLCQLPAITIAFGSYEQVAVLTSNGKSLEMMRAIIKEFKIDPEYFGSKFVIHGCEGVDGFEAVELGLKVDVKRVTPGIVSLAKEIVATNSKIRAFLFECTELPPYADAVRHATKLPVYDSITAAHMMLCGFQDNPRFGLNDWQYSWDGQIKDYSYAGNLTEEEKSRLVKKSSLSV